MRDRVGVGTGVRLPKGGAVWVEDGREVAVARKKGVVVRVAVPPAASLGLASAVNPGLPVLRDEPDGCGPAVTAPVLLTLCEGGSEPRAAAEGGGGAVRVPPRGREADTEADPEPPSEDAEADPDAFGAALSEKELERVAPVRGLPLASGDFDKEGEAETEEERDGSSEAEAKRETPPVPELDIEGSKEPVERGVTEGEAEEEGVRDKMADWEAQGPEGEGVADLMPLVEGDAEEGRDGVANSEAEGSTVRVIDKVEREEGEGRGVAGEVALSMALAVPFRAVTLCRGVAVAERGAEEDGNSEGETGLVALGAREGEGSIVAVVKSVAAADAVPQPRLPLALPLTETEPVDVGGTETEKKAENDIAREGVKSPVIVACTVVEATGVGDSDKGAETVAVIESVALFEALAEGTPVPEPNFEPLGAAEDDAESVGTAVGVEGAVERAEVEGIDEAERERKGVVEKVGSAVDVNIAVGESEASNEAVATFKEAVAATEGEGNVEEQAEVVGEAPPRGDGDGGEESEGTGDPVGATSEALAAVLADDRPVEVAD